MSVDLNYEFGCKYLDAAPDLFIEIGCGPVPAAGMAKSLWSAVRCIGFEPNSRLYNENRETYPGVLIPKAVRNASGDCVLFVSNGLSSLYDLENTTRVHVDSMRLDDLPEYLNALHGQQAWSTGDSVYLWLDCEGAELDVLNGGLEVLAQMTAIRCEMRENRLRGLGCAAREVDELLVDNGFKRRDKLHMRGPGHGLWDAIYTKE